MTKKMCKVRLCKSVIRFVLMCGVIALCCVFMQNYLAKVVCVFVLGVLDGCNLYEIIGMIKVLAKIKELTLLANVEMQRFEEWRNSHPDCDVQLYCDMREKEIQKKC